MTVPQSSIPEEKNSAAAIAIGASAGAIDALSALLPQLPRHYPLPIFLVVHIPRDKKSVMVECLEEKCQLQIQEVEDKVPICAGTVYVAPPDYHVLVEADHRLSLSTEEPVLYSRPSIDVLFESAADVYGPRLIGIVLTGANNDGTSGSKAVAAEGGVVIVQNPDGAYAAEMPRSALQACPGALVLNLSEIATYLQEVAQ